MKRTYPKKSCLKCGEKFVPLSSVTKWCHGCSENERQKRKRLSNVRLKLISRCENKKAKDYKWYGAKGIKVEQKWRTPKVFINWALKNGYEIGLQIDRIDTKGNYSETNCRFVTCKENQRNRINNTAIWSNGNVIARICKVCKVVKPITEFYKQSIKGVNFGRIVCKECSKIIYKNKKNV